MSRLVRRASLSASPIGETQYVNSGATSYTFTVPAGVFFISFGGVGVGSGGSKESIAGAANDEMFSGAGGNAAYINDVPVSPGDTFTIIPQSCSVQRVSDAAHMIRASGSMAAGAVRFSGGGGAGSSTAASGDDYVGGDSASFDLNGNSGAFSIQGRPGLGYDPASNSRGSRGQYYGYGGGTDDAPPDGGAGTDWQGGPGVVLVRWGSGGAFPGARP